MLWYSLVCGVATLLLSLGRNPSAANEEGELTVLRMRSLNLFLCHDTIAFARAGMHTAAHTNTNK